MRLMFGMFFDGADWSDKSASLGEIKMGPLVPGLAGKPSGAGRGIRFRTGTDQRIYAADPPCRPGVVQIVLRTGFLVHGQADAGMAG